jgi:hypothetical protein
MRKRAALVCALTLGGLPVRGEEPRRTRVYTNEDLERVSSRRGETGVLSRPGPADPAEPGSKARENEDRGRTRDEAYWRREAARVRHRVHALQEQARRLREQGERRAAARRGKGRGSPRDAWAEEDARARKLSEIEARIRELEGDLEDRARRAGALPGWLRS